MKKAIILIVPITILLLGAWLFASPYITLKRFGSALERGDASEISKYVDYQALREDLKKDLKVLLAKEVAKEVNTEEVGLFALTFGSLFIDLFVETAVSQEGLAYIMEKGRMPTEEVVMQDLEAKEEKPKGMEVATEYRDTDAKEELETSASYKGINTFVYQIRDKSSKEGIDLIFERRGLADWKLVGMDFHFKE